ncbi:hypothetical protein BDN72DRAFT_883529 [Pluteus cervinus]|uniref:Uncharacterized protein n=1 Tax=Pluteus cervinus TaxID=181527 RepID=A0ACD3A4I9_9AGAR|nr:hypothetical protein BDN72DRAFT_883529 [Pluteus cervinus]
MAGFRDSKSRVLRYDEEGWTRSSNKETFHAAYSYIPMLIQRITATWVIKMDANLVRFGLEVISAHRGHNYCEFSHPSFNSTPQSLCSNAVRLEASFEGSISCGIVVVSWVEDENRVVEGIPLRIRNLEVLVKTGGRLGTQDVRPHDSRDPQLDLV